MRPPGNTHAPPWNASFDDRRASNTSRPPSPSRTSTTVAAGAASAPDGLASLRSPATLCGGSTSLMGLRPPALELARESVDTIRASGSAPGRSSTERIDDELAVLVAGPQHLLVELADARLRHLGDEAPTFGHLPLRDPFAEE